MKKEQRYRWVRLGKKLGLLAGSRDIMGKEVPHSEIVRMAQEIASLFKSYAAGTTDCPQLNAWSREDIEGVADLVHWIIATDEPQGMEELRKVYQQSGGKPIKCEISYE